ncbi:hypothetical protein [Geminicoccus sp.]|jgi:putative transposase|uniref:hypothetical protein n=1 Tax=Geminicoccus sp. TaxID=2024832 RepID=UPI0039C8651D
MDDRLLPIMEPVGDTYDNAMGESFATLECELLGRRRLHPGPKARRAGFSFIEGWHRPIRLHSALGYRPPLAHEAEIGNPMAEP